MRSTLILIGLLACAPQPPDLSKKPGPTSTATTTAPPVTIHINEVVANNKSTAQDANRESNDWVEIHNAGAAPIDLTRLALWDRSEEPWAPREGILQPGEHLVLFSGGTAADGHLPFGLNASEGDELSLAIDGDVVETVTIPPSAEDVAYARHPDGGDWAFTTRATPGASNPFTPSGTLDPSDTVFVPDRYTEVHLQLTGANFETMNTWAEREVPCGITIDGIHFPDGSVRLKGSASFDLMDGKPAFKLDLNEYGPGGRFRGLKAFMLHNGNVYDPTRAHDYITYKLANEAGVAAPRVGWVKLTINQFDYGLYINVETHDDLFIERHWPGQQRTGMLFEPDFSGAWDFGTFAGVNFDYEEGPVGGDPVGMASVQRLNDVVKLQANDANIAEMWEVLDQDFLTYMAWEAVVNHSDGYRSPNNWRFYVNSDTHKVHFVPSGAEWTWSWDTELWWFGGRVADFCLNNAGCRLAYAQEVLRVADLVESTDLKTDFEDISTWLAPAINADSRSPHGTGAVNSARNNTLRYLDQNPDDARRDVYAAYPFLAP